MAKKIINVVYDVNDKDLDVAKKKIQDVEKETKKSETSFQKMGQTGMKAWGLVASAAAAIGLASIGKQIIDITSEFQKLGAVLTNTLGSRSQANQALNMIKEFAAKTPFSVVELTNSFVKLANQGFKPTIAELRKLGDLASSQGKGFDQLTEAIIDAQTGEFERLKEFGIRASKEGDNVTFTFKGVQTQTKFTADAMREYVLSLGDAAGVSGAMAAISNTLGGRISNLGDSWDSLLNTIGDGNKGILADTITLLGDIITKVNELVKTNEQINDETIDTVIGENVKNFQTYVDILGDANTALDLYQQVIDRRAAKLREEYKLVRAIADGETDADIIAVQHAKEREVVLSGMIDAYELKLIPALKEYITEQEKLNKKPPVEQLGLIESLEKKLKELSEARKKAFTTSEINSFNEKIRETQKELDKLTKPSDPLSGTKKMFKLLGSYLKEADALAEKRESENNDRSNENADRQYKYRQDKLKEAKEEEWKILEEAADKQLKLEQRIAELSIEFAAAALEFALTSREVDTQAISDKYETELALAGDNDRAKEQIELERDKKLRAAEIKNKQIQKDNARSKILIDTAVAVIKTFAEFGYPAGIVPAALMTGISLISLANVRKYKDGEVNIDGPGTSTSDSINARLSKGESVINAAATSKSQNLLEAINDRKIDDRILQVAANGGSQVNVFDDSRIIAELQKGRVDYDVHGYTLMKSASKGNNFKLLMRSKNQGY